MIRVPLLCIASFTLLGQPASKPSAVGSSQLGPLGATAFRDLVQRCVPTAPLATVRSIASVESAFNPLALSLNYPESAGLNLGIGEGAVVIARQPASLQEALSWSRWFLANGMTVSIGLMQVNVEHLSEVRLSLEQLFDPCINLHVGWTIFQRKYASAAALLGKGQLAVHAALSAYNTGDLAAGFANGYVSSVLSSAAHTTADVVETPTDAEIEAQAAQRPIDGPAPQTPVRPRETSEPASQSPSPSMADVPPPNPRSAQSRLRWDLKRAVTLWTAPR